MDDIPPVSSSRPPLGVILRIALLLFISEALMMGLFQLVGARFNLWIEALLDAAFVTLFTASGAYYWIFRKLLTAEPEGGGDGERPHPLTGLDVIMAKFGLVIFIVEAVIMLLLPATPATDPLARSLADAALLASLASPVSYFWIQGRWGAASQEELERDTASARIRSSRQIFLTMFTPAIVALSLLFLGIYQTEKQGWTALEEARVVHHLEMAGNAFLLEIDGMVVDLHLLANQADLAAFFSGHEDAREELSRDWRSFLAVHGGYHLIAFLDRQGGEILPSAQATDARGVREALAASGQLLEKIWQRAPGEVAVFPLALERGLFLALATPIRAEGGEIAGVLFLVVDDQALRRLLASIPEDERGDLLLLDERGRMLSTPPVGGGALFARTVAEKGVVSLHPDVWARLAAAETGSFEEEGRFFAFQTLHPQLYYSRDRDGRLERRRESHDHGAHALVWKLFSARQMDVGPHLGLRDRLLIFYLLLTALLAWGIWTIARAVHRRRRAEAYLEVYADQLEGKVKERTRQLVHAERLASLGTFAAGMAHEVNNPNSFISGNVQFLKLFWGVARPILERHLDEDPSGRVRRFLDEVDKTLEGILDGSRRISKIVDSLKTYSRGGGEADKVDCHLLDPINDALNLLRHRLKRFQVSVEVPSDLALYCDRQQISQVFVNLVGNAVEAMETAGMAEDGMRITVRGEKIDEHVWIRVIDNGPGIPDEAVGKIFDPFYTTKGKTKGTGLGLSIVQGIIEEHLGQITVFSAPGANTEFLFILPTPKLYREQLRKGRKE